MEREDKIKEDKLREERRRGKLPKLTPKVNEVDMEKEVTAIEVEPAEPVVKKPRRGKAPPSYIPAAGESGFIEKVITINRVTKVTKGGKKLSFSALVVVGDTKGKVGYSLGKAGEVATAIKKALLLAKRSMVTIPLKGSTIPHEVLGEWGAARVLLKPASDGTGVIAAGPVRAICDGAGIRNILTKCHRSNNPINVIKATMDGLSRLKPFNPPVESTPVSEESHATA